MEFGPALSTVLIILAFFIIIALAAGIKRGYAKRAASRRERPERAALERYLQDEGLCALSYAIHLLNLRGLSHRERGGAIAEVIRTGADVLFIGEDGVRFGRPITRAVLVKDGFVCSNCCAALFFDRPLGDLPPYRLQVMPGEQAGTYGLAMGRGKPLLRLAAIGCRKSLIGDRAVERQYVFGEDGDVVLLNVDGCSEEQAKGLAAFFNER